MILSAGKPAMILATTILFYIVCIFAGIYGLAAALINFIAMVGVIMFLFLLDWLQLGITLSILVISYLILMLGELSFCLLQKSERCLQIFFLHDNTYLFGGE